MKIQPRFTHLATVAGKAPAMAVLTMTLALSACGGGGSEESANAINPGNAATPPLSNIFLPSVTAPKSCNNVAGGLDTLQTALLSQLQPAALMIPTVGPAAASATTALSQALDTVDALTAALTLLAQSQNPQQFSTELLDVGNSLLCSSASLSTALAQLGNSQSLPVPGLAEVQQSLAAVAGRISGGLVGSSPGADLRLLTGQLVTLANQLASLSRNFPGAAGQPLVAELLSLNASTFSSLALILEDAGTLNGTRLASNVSSLLRNLGNSLQLAGQLGVPASALSPVTSQLVTLAGTIEPALAAVTAPTLQAVSAVLGGVSQSVPGSAGGAFSDLLAGSLTSSGSASSTERVTQITQQLTSTSLLSSLLQFFGGRLPI